MVTKYDLDCRGFTAHQKGHIAVALEPGHPHQEVRLYEYCEVLHRELRGMKETHPDYQRLHKIQKALIHAWKTLKSSP